MPVDVTGQSYVVTTKGESHVTHDNIANGSEFKCPFHHGCHPWLLRSHTRAVYLECGRRNFGGSLNFLRDVHAAGHKTIESVIKQPLVRCQDILESIVNKAQL